VILKHFLKFAKGLTFGLLILIPIASAIEISVSYLLQTITDTATGKGNLTYLTLVLIVAIYIILDAIVYFVTSYLGQTTLNKIIYNVKNRLLTSMFRQRTGVGQDVQKLTNEYYNDFTTTIDILRNEYLQGNLNAYKQICQLLIALVMSVLIKPTLSLIIVILCLPGILLPFYRQKKLKQNKQNVLKASQKYTSNLQDATAGLRTIQIFNIQKHIQNIFQRQNNKLLVAQNKDQLTRKQVGGVSQFLDNFLYLGTWVVGIYFVMNKSISLGQLVAFSQLMIFISEPIQSASGLISDILGSREAAKTINDKISNIDEPISSQRLNKLEKLSYQDVSLKDNNKSILKNINLNFDADKHYLIVGKSGSGKSTLINLPLSQTVIDGNILLNDISNDNYALAEISQHIGLLEQHSYIFNDTLKNNLALFSNKISDDDIISVLKKIGLDSFAKVESLQKRINAQSNFLSGGECRRLALGRLLLRSNELNLFDEPLTGLDPKTSHEISKILTTLEHGWIVVTHQYDQQLFEHADGIVVLDSGEVKVSGTFNNQIVKSWLERLNLISEN